MKALLSNAEKFHRRCVRNMLLLPITLPFMLLVAFPVCVLARFFEGGLLEARDFLCDELGGLPRKLRNLFMEVFYHETSNEFQHEAKK